jgi:hypothetical protein
VWAKISTSATAMACAACLAVATLPAIEKAESDLARTADVKLAVDLSQLAGFDAIPAYIAALLGGGGVDALSGVAGVNALTTLFGTGGVFNGGGINALFPDEGGVSPGYDALGALDVFFGNNDGTTGGGVFTGGGIDALNNYAALSAIPVFVGTDGVFTGGGVDALSGYDALSAIPVFVGTDGVFTGGGVNALGGYAALSAVDTFFGDNNGEGGVFTGGGIDALAPDADGNGGYAALSALPVFFGRATTDNGTPTSFGPGVFTGGGVDALKNYDALSAIPAYLAPTPPLTMAPLMAAATPTPPAPEETSTQSILSTTSTTSSGPVDPVTPRLSALRRAALPQAPPAPEAVPQVEQKEIDPTVTTPDNSGPKLNVARASEKFSPESIGKSPILFGTGTPGVDNGIRGWGDGLKKLGIGGGDASSSGGTDAAK